MPEATQALFSAALLDATLPVPVQLVSRSDGERRFAVHRNNVVSALIDAVAGTFPVVQWLVGETFFRAMASVYVRDDPPRSPVLSEYGGSFAGFIERFAPVAGLAYLADVARLEFAGLRALHSADMAVQVADLRASIVAAGESVGDLRIRLHPGLQAGSSAHAAPSICRAHALGNDLAAVDVELPESWLVLRAGLVVEMMVVDAATVAFVLALQAGTGLGEAADRARALQEDFDVADALGRLSAHAQVIAIERP